MQSEQHKISHSLSAKDYRKKHESFMRGYKELYEEVAGFALLPERFINEADPIIQQFSERLKDADTSALDKLRMQVITDFIDRFYSFMDKAAEMFTEHQALAEHTLDYLKELSMLKQAIDKKTSEEMEEEYTRLMPQLEKLNSSLIVVKQKITLSKNELNVLTPIWAQILERMPAE